MSAEKTQPNQLAYTRRQLCHRLGISARTLARLEKRGLLKSAKALRTKLHPHTEIERFLQETI